MPIHSPTGEVVVRCRKAGRSVDPRTIQRRCKRLLEHLDHPDASLSILLCDDAFIHTLNLEYRQMDHPTDVLSFSMAEGPALEGDSKLLGDIIISTETAARQAPLLGHTITQEVTSLVIHGLLHLLGYDHQTAREEKEMQTEAQRLSAIVIKTSHHSNNHLAQK